ncbi:tripartite tricarboxylate transporter substrate binding protein [Larsenimonas rhizosphaerae]|uniref:Tripartite tricarboxylate transporter substrate binding protein n=1 Tax=Larsenimonas rhizosphaerae TaxID=2944682 RepID=A0AA42CVP6_9GAMM|nr:tripartite tricarboxylate transporter substrate binding protein [Larsenimonas rhizosphaerae]MCX2525156.1 tripartite tricarboxylate transporter substrate binding protein [Larsenimonas rhizosphaerae]
MLKTLLATLTFSAGAMLLAGPAQAADYPQRNIEGIIQWGAGGATDNVARSLTPYVEEALKGKVILNNRPGGTGVIGMNTVMRKPANGYTVLYGAENPQLYPVMGLADFDYSDMTPINVIGQGMVVIAVPADSPYNSMDDLLKAAHDKPGELRMGGTGAGGLPSTVLAMINSVDSLDVRSVTFGGDGPGITAMLGNHIDFMPLSLAAAQEQIKAGRLKGLAVISKERLDVLPKVPTITEALPKIGSYMPWGPFWVVAVRKDTPDDIKATLSKAYQAGVANKDFQAFIQQNGAETLNLTGQEAVDFLHHWQSVTAWAMQSAGTAKVSPEKLGIPKP